MIRVNSIIAFLLFLLVFAIYSIGVSPSVYGGDSGDIILAAWFGGVAHPPGYPLNTMLGWVFTHLPYSAAVAYKANLMAAFLHAAVISVFFLILQKVAMNTFASIVAVLILAFNPLFWLYGHILEVFQLNLLLVSISVYFLILWRDTVLKKKEFAGYLYISIAFLGLAVFHHHTSILLFPAFFYLVRATKKKIFNLKNVFTIGLFFSIGFVPYIFIPLAAVRQTPINWDNPVNIQNFIRLITRADYGTFTAAGFIIGAGLKQQFVQIVNLLLFIKADFGIIGLITIVIGASHSFFKSRQIFWFTFITFIFVGPFFLVYSSFPFPNSFYAGLWERFLLITYLFLSIYLVFGIKLIFDLIDNISDANFRILNRTSLRILFFLVLLIFPLYLLRINFFKTDLSNFYLGDWLGYDVLASAESNSIIFVFGDTSAFNTQYVYYTTPNLRNIKLIKGGSLYAKEYREQIAREFPQLKIPDNFFSDKKLDSDTSILALIKLNNSNFDIYAMDFTPQIEGFKWSSSGLLKKLTPTNVYDKFKVIDRNDDILSSYKYHDFLQDTGYEQYISAHIKEIYANSQIDLADELISNSLGKEAIKYLENAIALSPNLKDAYVRIGNIYFIEFRCEESRTAFEKAILLDKKDWKILEAISKVYGECFHDSGNADLFKQRAEELKSKLENTPL